MTGGYKPARVRFWEGSRGRQTPVGLSVDGPEQPVVLLREELVQDAGRAARPHRRYLVALPDGRRFLLRPGPQGWEAKGPTGGN